MNEIITGIGFAVGVVGAGGLFYYKNKFPSSMLELKTLKEQQSVTQDLKRSIETQENKNQLQEQSYAQSVKILEKNQADLNEKCNSLVKENNLNKEQASQLLVSLKEQEQRNKVQEQENSQLRHLGLIQENKIKDLEQALESAQILVEDLNKKTVLNSSVSSEPKSVLVVDDSLVVRNKLKKLLESNDFKVTTANDGMDALEVLKDNSFSLIITDLEMPNLNGFGLMEEISKSHSSKIPVMAITGHEHVEMQLHQCESLYGIHKKPYDEKSILTKVHQLTKITH